MSTVKPERQPERQRQIALLVGVVVVAVAALVLIILSNQSASFPAPPPQATATPAVETAVADADSEGGSQPTATGAGATEQEPTETAEAAPGTEEADGPGTEAGGNESIYAGIRRGISEEGLPMLGAPDAPLVIYEYSSFGCGHCANFHDNQFMALLDDVRAGRVTFVYVPVTDQFSAPASATALCALDQGRFWEMHDLLFVLLRQYAGSAYTQDKLAAAVAYLGLDPEAFNECMMSDDILDRLNAANALFLALANEYQGEVTGTPTLTLNGVPPEITPNHRSGAPSLDYLRNAIAEANQ